MWWFQMNPLRRHDTAEAIRNRIESDHCIPVDVRIIGEDPGNRAVRAVAVYRIPDSIHHEHGLYVVMDCWDHTTCRDRNLRAMGLRTSNDLFGVTRTEALREATRKVGQLMADFTWFVPGTEELVPGCWGYME